jgi:hypothetical protein
MANYVAYLEEEFEALVESIESDENDDDVGSSSWMVPSKVAHWGGRVISDLIEIDNDKNFHPTDDILELINKAREYIMKQRDSGNMKAMDVPFYKVNFQYMMDMK